MKVINVLSELSTIVGLLNTDYLIFIRFRLFYVVFADLTDGAVVRGANLMKRSALEVYENELY